MTTTVRCKCGWTGETRANRALRCPKCGNVMHVVATDWRDDDLGGAVEPEASRLDAVRDLLAATGQLFNQLVWQHPFRIVSAVVILALLFWLVRTTLMVQSTPSPLQEDYQLAMELIDQGKTRMACSLLQQIVDKAPRSPIARRARTQLNLLGTNLPVRSSNRPSTGDAGQPE